MEIIEAIVHYIEKSANSDVVSENPRTTLSAVDEVMTKLAEEVLKIYGRVNNTYGTFDSDPEYQFKTNLAGYVANDQTFVQFTTAATHQVAIAMRASLLSTGGYALFIRYNNLGRDWLLIVMLKLKNQTGIDEKTLELNQSSVFDIKNLNEAARVDIGKWQADDQPYVSFIKKSDDQITRYFLRAIGCTDYTDSKQNTEQTLKAVDDYCQFKQFDQEGKQAVRRATFEYLDAKHRSSEPANLIALSAILFDQVPDEFISFVRQGSYRINESFAPHQKTYVKFKRIVGKVNTVKISFDVVDLINGTVNYDKKSNMLVIKAIPASLAEQITEAQGLNGTAN